MEDSKDTSTTTGEQAITTDDLIFQIGEKEVDLQRKRVAIKNLQNNLNEYQKIVYKKDNEIDELKKKTESLEQGDKNQSQIQELNESLSEKDNEIQKLNELLSEKNKQIKNFEEEKESQVKETTSKLEKERKKVRDLRNQLDTQKSKDFSEPNGEHQSFD